MKQSKQLRFVAALLAVGLLPAAASAELADPSKTDVTIAQMTSPYKAHFPDAVRLPQNRSLPKSRQSIPMTSCWLCIIKTSAKCPAPLILAAWAVSRLWKVRTTEAGK